MNVEASLSQARRGLIEALARIISDSRDGPDVAAMLKAARASGLLQPAELQVFERRVRLPDWLLEGLGLAAVHPVSTQFTAVTASSGRPWRLSPPVVLGEAALPRAFEATQAASPDVQVISGEGAEIVLNGRAKAAFLDDGYVPGFTDLETLWASGLAGGVSRPLPGRTLILFVEGSHLLSHWLLDTLPRVAALTAVGRSLGDYDQVLLAATPQPFHAQSLEALGLPPEKVLTRAGSGSRFRCEAFDFVTSVRQGYVAEPWVYDFVERLFLAASPTPPTRKLFISRRKAARRRIVNEAELHPLLEARGYRIIDAEAHTLFDMARLCAEATTIVGPHGAGLANAVFSRPGARVLEIFGAHSSPEYWRIASQRELTYACCQAVDSDGRPFDEAKLARLGVKTRKEADMTIAPDVFARHLDAFEAL